MYKLKWVPGWTRLEPVLMSSNEVIVGQGYKVPSHDIKKATRNN